MFVALQGSYLLSPSCQVSKLKDMALTLFPVEGMANF